MVLAKPMISAYSVISDLHDVPEPVILQIRDDVIPVCLGTGDDDHIAVDIEIARIRVGYVDDVLLQLVYPAGIDVAACEDLPFVHECPETVEDWIGIPVCVVVQTEILSNAPTPITVAVIPVPTVIILSAGPSRVMTLPIPSVTIIPAASESSARGVTAMARRIETRAAAMTVFMTRSNTVRLISVMHQGTRYRTSSMTTVFTVSPHSYPSGILRSTVE